MNGRIASGQAPFLVKLGIWGWGFATAIMAVAIFAFLAAAAIYVVPPDAHSAEVQWHVGTPNWVPGVYLVLKDHNQLVAAILAVSGLAWSYFFQWKRPRIDPGFPAAGGKSAS